MNHALWKATGARVLAMTFIIAGVVACDRGDSTANNVRQPAEASPSAQVVGQAPATPTGDPAGTTPVSPAARSDVGKPAEDVSRPLEGDNHSYSTVSPVTPQKSNGINETGKN